jgi:hypothetical protein
MGPGIRGFQKLGRGRGPSPIVYTGGPPGTENPRFFEVTRVAKQAAAVLAAAQAPTLAAAE